MKSGVLRIALVGGGPSALFMYRRLIASGNKITISLFEKSGRLGAGMPYSRCGAGDEHVTNVSANEIPDLPLKPLRWLEGYAKQASDSSYVGYNPYKVFPRKLFGDYLEAQFHDLIASGNVLGIKTEIFFNTKVVDISRKESSVVIFTETSGRYSFDKVIICTGHQFPSDVNEAETGYYQSPYPPQKLSSQRDHAVALRGASLTAIDAIKTISRANGSFRKTSDGSLIYKVHPSNPNFKIVLHCRSGMLPAVRFHLQDSRLKNPLLLTSGQIAAHRATNEGFLSLDYIFEKDFKEPLRKTAPSFYEKVKDLTMEEFVNTMLALRESTDPFVLLEEECRQAARSIEKKESIPWKEMLGVLSFALNYPAKYFSAEDMLRYKSTLHPLLGLIIAYIPQSSCKELLALHKAGCLELINVGKESRVERAIDTGIVYHYHDELGNYKKIPYQTYIDCTGQQHIDLCNFPFRSLVREGSVAQAKLRFQSAAAAISYRKEHPEQIERGDDGLYYLKVAGVAINDNFQVIARSGTADDGIFMMAVPLMGGFNPDYSGLDFAEEASERIAYKIFQEYPEIGGKTTPSFSKIVCKKVA